jgi:oxygen-independent coproporphyrinogen-3 oxidase
MLGMICREIETRSSYLELEKKSGWPVGRQAREEIKTIYFGGGTPSLLSHQELSQVFETLHKEFNISSNAEITLEANPDDLDETTLLNLKKSGVNRLSIGIQSFNDDHLKYLNRIHSGKDAFECVRKAQRAGFDNISIDLIYGIPAANHDIWGNDLRTALKLSVQHISSYCLTIEPATVFGKWLKRNIITPIDEEMSARQFEILMETLHAHGFEHYEISNFSLPDFHSKHNCNYWNGKKYLGVGPGAHSYNGKERQFNVSNNPAYIKSIENGNIPATVEKLSEKDKINEYLITSLRTKWGCDLNLLKTKPEFDFLRQAAKIKKMEFDKLLINNNGILILTDKGKLLADKIIYDLFLI